MRASRKAASCTLDLKMRPVLLDVAVALEGVASDGDCAPPTAAAAEAPPDGCPPGRGEGRSPSGISADPPRPLSFSFSPLSPPSHTVRRRDSERIGAGGAPAPEPDRCPPRSKFACEWCFEEAVPPAALSPLSPAVLVEAMSAPPPWKALSMPKRPPPPYALEAAAAASADGRSLSRN